jgi:Ca2+-binding RTX toxin-like protein
VAGNTILNDNSASVLAVRNQTSATALIEANRFHGLSASQIASGPAHVTGSSFLATEPTLNTAAPFTNTALAAQALAAGGSATTQAGMSNLVVLTTGSENVAANGSDTVLAGSGSDTVHAGLGHVSVVGGTGTLTFLDGAGTASIVLEPGTRSDIALNGAGTVTVAGAATVTGGSGADLYNLVNGYGGSDMINQFKVGTDHLRLQ